MDLSSSTEYTAAANRLMNALHLSHPSRKRLADVATPEFLEGDSLDATIDKIDQLAGDILQSQEHYKAEASKSKIKTVQRWSGELLPYLKLVLNAGKSVIEVVRYLL
jgi:hypothetical protein